MPGPYTVIIYDDRGKPVGSTTFPDACQALNFLDAQAALLPPERRGVRDGTVEGIEYLRKVCKDEGTPTTPSLPADAPAVSDPSATGTDTLPPGGEETSETLKAPKPETSIEVTSGPTPPGESDGRPLSERYYDPANPMPDYDLESILAGSVPLDELERAVEDVIYNEPPPGLPHPYFGRDDSENPTTVVDPVDAFSGQYLLTVTDITIPSRGFPLQLIRKYHSGPVYFGPWGYNWDHNYNVYLRELSNGGVAIWTGRLTEHVYELNPDGSFEPPSGVFNKLEWQISTPLSPDRYILTDRDGMQYIFERLSDWPYSDRIPLVRVEDRHGNAHQLAYDAEAQLERVEDHAGRFIQFTYGDCDLLEQVSDHTGRVWHYIHDPEIEHLVAVTTPTTSDYPEGLTTCYEYDRYRRHPALLHNLTRVIDPAGQVVVENQYGDDPGTDDFGRVVYQEFGGYVATFQATRLQYVPRVPGAINVPALRVEVVDPGVLYVYTFNYRGDLIDERFRLAVDRSYRLVARIYRYDEQGNQIERREPNGLGMLFTFDHENADPRARGNVLRISLSAPPTRPAPGRDIARFTYESRYQRLKTTRDESGTITTMVYDYEEIPDDRGDVIRIEYPTVTLPDGSPQESHEHFTYNAFGQLIERRSGEGHIFTYEFYAGGSETGYLKRTVAGPGVEDLIQEFGYDQFGNLSAVTDSSVTSIEYEYNALGQLTRALKPDVNGSRGEVVYRYGRDGRLKCQETPRGIYQDSVISDPYILHEFEFDVLGYVRSAVYGANTVYPRTWQFKRTAEGFPCEIVDPIGRVIHQEYDERSLLLRQTLFVGTSEERSIDFINDRNGNRIRVIDPAGREIEDHYDSWDRLGEVMLPGLEGTRTRVHYTHGMRDQIERVEVTGVPAPGQAPVLLSELSYQFDEWGRLVRRTQGLLNSVFWYDRDSCLAQVVDERGNSVSFTCDALGRVRTSIDPFGNQINHAFDSRGSLVAVEQLEVGPGLATPEIYQTTMTYDARSRLTSTTDPLGNTLMAEYDDRDLLLATTSPSGTHNEYEYNLEGLLTLARGFTGTPPLPIEHRWQRDLGGRVTSYVDPEGKETRYAYGLEDQWVRIELADGSSRERIFDMAGQLVREVAPSGTTTEFSYAPDGLVERMHFIASPGVIGVPDIEYSRDGLGQAVRLTQGGVTLDFEYDLLGRLIRETMAGSSTQWSYDDLNGWADLTYPDGRVDRFQLDALGRISAITLHQPAATPLTGAALGSGTTLANYEYVGPQRLHRRVLGNGCETQYTYDRGRRLTGIDHRAADDSLLALVQYVYDAAGRRRLVRAEPAPGRSTLFEYDQLSRLYEALEGIVAPAPPLNATQAEADSYLLALGSPVAQRTYNYTLDHSDARSQKSLTEPTGTTTDDYMLNDLHQITQLTRTSASTTSTSPFTHDLDGHRTGDDRYQYTYDALGRLTEVRDTAGTTLLMSQEFDPAGRVMIRTLNGGVPERIRYLGARPLQDETVSGIPLRQRCFGMNVDELIAQSEGDEGWGHQDGRLSLIALSDSTGQPIERYSYSPFGLPAIWASDGVTPRAASSLGMQPIFGGHRSLQLNGLYDARARVYDADTGCFLQRDPRGYSDSANPYAYVSANPIDLTDPTGEILPIIAAGFIAGVVAGVVYTGYESYHHPERYEGWGALRGPGNVAVGAGVGVASAVLGEAVAATAGASSLFAGGTALGSGVAVGGTLGWTQTFVLAGTVSSTSGIVWQSGFHYLFPELVEPPSAVSVTGDFVLGGGIGVGFRVWETMTRHNPFSRANLWRRRIDAAVAELRKRLEEPGINRDVAKGLRSKIAELYVARYHAEELPPGKIEDVVGVTLDKLGYPIAGEIDVVLPTAWIQVKTGPRGYSDYQTAYTVFGAPSGRSIFYVPENVSSHAVRRLISFGVTEVRPLTSALRGIESFPFGGMPGISFVILPWSLMLPESTPPAGGASTSK